jgi:hypothetical protein
MKCKIIKIKIIDHEIAWFDQWHMIAFAHYMCKKMILSRFNMFVLNLAHIGIYIYIH